MQLYIKHWDMLCRFNKYCFWNYYSLFIVHEIIMLTVYSFMLILNTAAGFEKEKCSFPWWLKKSW